MATFRTYGGMDDRHEVDGDVGFVGMNQRDQPNQLRAGEVVMSRNGRMDGYWQPRKGIRLVSGGLGSSEKPILLPFVLIDVSKVVVTAARVSGVVTINMGGAHGILASDLPSYITLGSPVSGVEPLSGVSAGSYLMSYVDGDSLSFEHAGLDGALVVDGVYGYISTILNDGAVAGVFGSCVFSDPSSSLDESIFIATGNFAKKFSVLDNSVVNVPYPFGLGLVRGVELLQAFDRVYLFREGDRAWEYIPKGRGISFGNYVSVSGEVTLTLRDHGFTVGDGFTVEGLEFSAVPLVADPNGHHVVSSVVDADTFKYVIGAGYGDETYVAGTGLVIADGFTMTPSGDYTQPQYFNIAGNAYGVTNGLVRFTVVGNTTITAGDRIRISSTDVALIEPIVGETFIVTDASATDIYFNAPLPDKAYGSGGGSSFIEFGSRYSLGLGFTHMTGVPWAVYFQRRLWTPYFYEPSGSRMAPVFTDREIRDEICVSDILDPNTFDTVASQFRVTAGIADYLVGLHPFYDDKMLVMNRNSVHLISGTQGTLSDTTLREVTREVGCLARRTIVSQGANIFFLSDNGVYGLSFVDEYNLRGVDEPLSKNIQPFIDRINSKLADKSVGYYFNNRYFLAVPLDKEKGSDDAMGNNTVLVYNILNKAWESIDRYGLDNDFNITNFLKAQSGSRNDLYIVNESGGIHLCDASDYAQDIYSTDAAGGVNEVPIYYELTTRGYSFSSYGRKKFTKATVQMQSSPDNATDVSFIFSTEDPDTVISQVADIATLLDPNIGLTGQLEANETADFSFRLGNARGVYGVLSINSKTVGDAAIGRPKVTSIMLEATQTSRQTITQY